MVVKKDLRAELSRMSRAELLEKLQALRDQAQSLRARQCEEDLLKSDALYRRTERLAKLGHWEWDEIQDRCIYCSDELARLHGLTAAEFLERASSSEADLQWVHPDDRRGFQTAVDELHEHLGGIDYEYRLLQPDGTYLEVREVATPVLNEDGVLVRSIGFVQDISDRKRAERAVRQSQAEAAEAQERLMQAMEACPEGFAWYDADDRLVAFNKKHQEIYAASADLIRPGALFEDIIRQGAERGQYPEATGRLETWVAKRLEQFHGGADASEQLLPDGRWVQISERRLPDGGVVGNQSDITKLKRAEESLRESETLLRQAADMARLGHWVWDETEGRCAYCSETLARMNGVTVEEYLARYATIDGLLEEVHPEDRANYLRVIEQAAEEKRAYSMEFRELRPDGSIRYLREQGEPVLDATGRLVRTVGTLQDITEHRETQQALEAARDDLERRVAERTEELRKNQAHLKAIMDHAPVQIGLKDPESRYVLVNREFEERFGILNREISGKLPHEVFSEEHAAHVRAHDEAVLETKQAVQRVLRVDIDGETRTFLVVKFPALDGDGDVTGIGAVAADITERTRAEDALRERDARLHELQGQLEQFSRASAMGQLSRTLAYDLSQPVTAMMNYCAAAQRLVQAGPRPDSERVVEIMDKAIRQAARIGDDLRALRGLFDNAKRTTSAQDINQIVEDARALALINPARSGAQCAFERGHDLPSVSVSRLEIQQVVFNLIKNALEAMTQLETGEVTIETLLNDSGMVEVVVSDTGCGIPKEIENQMFQPFVTTKPNSLGLGLSISQTIIEAYAGRLWSEANPGGGTRVHFTLPGIRDAR